MVFWHNTYMNQTARVTLKENMKTGRVYRRHELRSFSTNLSRDIEKLMKEEAIVQAAPGLYYKPKMTKIGMLPATTEELVRAFLNDGDFLLTSLDQYNPLGVGLTQLYNETIVYNRKRHGNFVLDGRRFSFRRANDFPLNLTKEFLYVDLLNNKDELLEDTSHLEERMKEKTKELDRKRLLATARKYGKVATRKFFEELAL